MSFLAKGLTAQPCSEIYAGNEPFSEVESKTISEYIKSISDKFYAYISFHSYSQLLMYPYGYTNKHLDNYEDLVRNHIDNDKNIFKNNRIIYISLLIIITMSNEICKSSLNNHIYTHNVILLWILYTIFLILARYWFKINCSSQREIWNWISSWKCCWDDL